MRNPATLTAAALGLLVLGFVAGLMVGERRQGEVLRSATPAPGRAADPTAPRAGELTPAVKSTDSGSPVDETARLRERVQVLEVELQALRDTTGPTPAKKAGDEVAERAFSDLLAASQGRLSDPEQIRSLFANLSQLDAGHAKNFIDRYRKLPAGKDTEKERTVAVELALMSGGPDAAQFLQSLIKDQSLEPSFRKQMLAEIGVGGGLFSIKRLPVDEALGSTAMGLLRSDKMEERGAGASLLGGVATPASRLELERMLTQETDLGVRLVVIRSLGMVGDPSTRKLLEPLAAQSQDKGLQKAAEAAIRELDRPGR